MNAFLIISLWWLICLISVGNTLWWFMCSCLYLSPMQVLRTALSNRLAKVQGFLFRAAFLRRVPLFLRLISENLLLCFLLSTLHSTSKYVTGILSLHFRKILTQLIHTHYFQVLLATIYWSSAIDQMFILSVNFCRFY